MEPSTDSGTDVNSPADDAETIGPASDSPPSPPNDLLQNMELHSSEEDSVSLEAVTPPLDRNGVVADANEGGGGRLGEFSAAEIPEDVDRQTVRVLDGPGGARVWLIGTAHFSKKSQDDVASLVRHVKPHVLMLELCDSRAGLLQLDESSVRQQLSELSASQMVQLMKRQGVVAGCLHLLLIHVSAKLTEQLGMAPGGELRRAYNESQLIPPPYRCLLHLGDRPIQATLRRALAGLSVWQRIRLAYVLLTSNTTITSEEVERCKERDVLESMMAELAGDFPSLGRVFVGERDRYLSGSLWHCCLFNDDYLDYDDFDQNYTSRRRVLAVVGMGHVEGMLQHWGRVSEEEMRELLVVPDSSVLSRVIVMSLRISTLSALVYAGYRWFPLCCGHLQPVGSWLANCVRRGFSASQSFVSSISKSPTMR